MRDVFVSGVGQPDNIGDSILRRAFIDSLRTPATRLHVLTGGLDPAYVSGLGLAAADVRYESGKSWRKSAFKRSLAGRAVFAFTAGELSPSRSRLKFYLVDGTIVRIAGIRKGFGIHSGVGIRNPQDNWKKLVAWTVRPCRFVTWRDAPSREAANVGRVVPDWAFIEGRSDDLLRESTGDTGSRDLLAVSMRGDRPYPTTVWFEAVREVAKTQGLRIVVVSQVGVDAEKSSRLAIDLDAELVPFLRSRSHTEQEAIVRDTYGRSRGVVSDRLHALVIGLTEGAAPLGYTVASPEKIDRTFAGADIHDVGLLSSAVESSEATETMILALEKRPETIIAALKARERIRNLRTEFVEALQT